MIRNAVGTLINSTAVAATTNRTSHRFVARKSRMPRPNTTMTTISPAGRTARIGSTVKITWPPRVRRLQVLVIAVIAPAVCELATSAASHCSPTEVRGGAPRRHRPEVSLVHPAHDRVEARHDGHRVGDEVARHQQADRLEVEVRRVVDPHPERLVRPVADDVRGVLPARPLDPGVGSARSRTEKTRQLGHDRPIGHLVEALVDDPQALLDLVEAYEVAGEAVALGPGRDVELELRKHGIGVGSTEVERDAGGPQVRP